MISRFNDVLMNCLQQQDTWHVYLLQNWNDIMGDLHTRMCLERISGDTLIIGVHDVHWMQELFCLGQELVAHVNSRLASNYVKNVRFVLSKSRHQPKKMNKRAPGSQSSLAKTVGGVQQQEKCLTDRENQALCSISDPQLKDLLRQLMARGRA